MKSTPTVATAAARPAVVQWRDLNWTVIGALLLLHIAAVAVVLPWFFTWSGLILLFALTWISGGLGITLCYHRLLTHRSFKTPRWCEYLLSIFGCLAWQGGPIDWVGVRRLHHKHADTDRDPHTPRHGFTWSHVLWILHRRIDGIRGRDAAKDLQRDPGMRWIDRLFWAPQLALAGALLIIGWTVAGPWTAVSWVLWGVALRTVLVFHGTWFVNSASHTWGYQNYKDTHDRSTNLWWVSLLSFGEGWHNNHHAHPRSAAHGLRKFEVDPTWWTIRLMSHVGLASEIRLPPSDEMP